MPTTDELLERIETLEQEQAKLQKKYQVAKEQNEQVLNLFEQFKSGSISRRAFLTSVSAVAGISWLAGSADAAPNWSNAAGNSGTESEPLKNVYAQNGTFQSVSTDSLNITEQINYWPPVRTGPGDNLEVSDNSPPTSYTTVTISGVPTDATVCLLALSPKGDGTSNVMGVSVRENGSSRAFDARVNGWAGHGDFTSESGPFYCPMDPDNKIEYKGTGNEANVDIKLAGYF
jgi:hypothetical protein